MPDTEIGNQTKIKSFWTEIHFNQQHMCLLTVNNNNNAEMYPGFQIMGSSGPLLEKFGGPLLSFGGPANL